MKAKRFLALVIIVVYMVCLSSAPGFSSELRYDPLFENKLSFLKSLGIDEADTVSPNGGVKRAQFVAMAVSLLPVRASNEITDAYIDVNSDTVYAAEISAAYNSKLISVGFERRFNPLDDIKLNEALKIAVSALGYSQLSEVWGGYPYGFAKVADKLKLSTASGGSGDEYITGEDAVDIVYNCFTAPLLLVESIANGEATYTTDSSRCVLTEYYHLRKIEGLVTSGAHASLRDNHVYHKDTIEVEGRSYKCAIQNVDEYVGYTVAVWIDDTDCVKCIDYMPDNKTVEFDGTAISGFDNHKFTVSEGDREKTYTIDPGYTFMKNGMPIIFDANDYATENAVYTLIDNNSDNRYDIVKCEETKYLHVNNIDSEGRIYDKNKNNFVNGSYIMVSGNHDCYADISVYDDDTGMYVAGELSDIKAGMVLSVVQKPDGSFSKITAADITVSAKVDECGDDEMIIGGMCYPLSNYFKKFFSATGPGDSGVFYFSADGKLVSYSPSANTNMKYAYLIDAHSINGMDKEVVIKVMETSGQKNIYQLATDVILDEKKRSESSDEINSALFSAGYPKYGLIKYSLNSDGEVNRIDTPEMAFDGSKVEDVFSASSNAASSFRQYMNKDKFWFKYYQQTAVANFNFGSTVIFRVPSGIAEEPHKRYDENFFKVDTVSYLKDDDKCLADSFDYNSDFQPAAVVLYDIEGGVSGGILEELPGHSRASYLVDGVSSAITPDGDSTTKLTLYDGTSYTEKYIAPELNPSYVAGGKIPGVGDIIRISEMADNVINGILIDVDYNPVDKSLNVNYSNNGVTDSLAAYLTYVKGRAFASSENMLSLVVDYIPSTTLIDTPYNNLFVFKATNANAACFDTKQNRAVPAYVNDIIGTKITAAEAYRVVVRCSSGTFSKVFIYK